MLFPFNMYNQQNKQMYLDTTQTHTYTSYKKQDRWVLDKNRRWLWLLKLKDKEKNKIEVEVEEIDEIKIRKY